MKYVGIKNSDLKTRATKLASRVGKIITVQLPCLTADDCQRHFELLRMFDKKDDDFFKSSYYKFQRKNGKKDDDIFKKIEDFKKLYKSIRKNGYEESKGYIIISEDGARLDGSHRASIVEHLGYKQINVLMVKWQDCFPKEDYSEIVAQLNDQKRLYNII